MPTQADDNHGTDGLVGVRAVRTGPMLAANLIAAIARGTSRYTCWRRGAHYAVASRARLSAEGQWVRRWKDRIDCGFVEWHSRQEEAR